MALVLDLAVAMIVMLVRGLVCCVWCFWGTWNMHWSCLVAAGLALRLESEVGWMGDNEMVLATGSVHVEGLDPVEHIGGMSRYFCDECNSDKMALLRRTEEMG